MAPPHLEPVGQLEIELKLSAPPGVAPTDVAQSLAAYATLGQPRMIHQTDVYYDDEADTLARAGLSARVREAANESKVQVKSVPIIASAIASRVEIGSPLHAGDEPGDAIRDLVESTWPLRLVGTPSPRVSLETERTLYDVDADGCRALLGVDRVTARRPGHDDRSTFCEVELELAEGDERAFERLASTVAGALDLPPSTKSKHVRVLRLLGLPGFAYRIEKPTFDADAPTGTVARAIVGRLAKVIQRYESGTRVGADPEQLHKMRVATRRLRNALRVFSGSLPKAERKALGRELSWLADVLGDVRDLDVMQAALRDWRAEYGPEPARGFDQLARELRALWQEARVRLISALDSPRYAGLIRRLAAAQSMFSNETRVEATATRRFEKRNQNVQDALARALSTHAPDDLHTLRIAGKKLRYTLELLAPVLSGATRERAKQLEALQDALGTYQDHTQAAAFTARLLEAADGADSEYVTALRAVHDGAAAAVAAAPNVLDEAARLVRGHAD